MKYILKYRSNSVLSTVISSLTTLQERASRVQANPGHILTLCCGDFFVLKRRMPCHEARIYAGNCSDPDPCLTDCNDDNQVNLVDLVMMKTQFLRSDCPE